MPLTGDAKREYQRQWRLTHPGRRERELAHRRGFSRRNKERLEALEEAQPCADCGVSFPHYVMEWDHCRGEKHRNVTSMMNCSWEQIEAELAKCDLVCSNCHSVRGWRRRSDSKRTLH